MQKEVMGNGRYFGVGVFGETEDHLGDFGSTFYLSLLLSQSCEQYDEIAADYEKAKQAEDTDLIAQKQLELSICHSTLAITAKMLESYSEINS